MADVQLRVNGTNRRLELDPRVSLLDALREHLGLTGTKKGCNQGACGACTVLVDGERIVSCLGLAVQYGGREVTTIEGIGEPGRPHPLQEAFVRFDGYQCGFCTSGQICSAVGMLAEHGAGAPSAVTSAQATPGEITPEPDAADATPVALSESEIKERMSGNLCRCGAYEGIVGAIQYAAGVTADGRPSEGRLLDGEPVGRR